MSNIPVGKTKDAGWEIGVSRQFEVSTAKAWDALMTQPGLGYWLGKDDGLEFKKDATFKTVEGTTGRIISFDDGSMVRLRFQPHGWKNSSTLQVRATPAGNKSTISFHQEKLQNAEQRETMHAYWSDVLDQLELLFTQK